MNLIHQTRLFLDHFGNQFFSFRFLREEFRTLTIDTACVLYKILLYLLKQVIISDLLVLWVEHNANYFLNKYLSQAVIVIVELIQLHGLVESTLRANLHHRVGEGALVELVSCYVHAGCVHSNVVSHLQLLTCLIVQLSYLPLFIRW